MRTHEIRADYDCESIVIYQAYRPEIARPAVGHGRFVPPFSRTRMTWIKPSFLWLMARSGWARKPGQEMILAVRITREGWEDALSGAVLSHADRRIHRDTEEWRAALAHAQVRVQWDPERTLHGQTLEARSIQIGLGRHIIDRYADDWTLDIQDITPLVREIHRMVQNGDMDRAKDLLPPERVYPLSPEIAGRIGADA
jgi:hypothetical protein